MSAATTASPAVVRSSSRRQQSYTAPAADRPPRTPSSSTRSPTTPGETHRTDSHSYSHNRGPSASQQAALAGVARRDYETSNVAQPPSSRRSSSRDRSYAVPPPNPRTESTRSSHRNSSRSRHSRYNSDTSGTVPTVVNGGPTPVQASSTARPPPDVLNQGGSGTVKRRTTISAQTGQWALGKTIGAGSMGKVKLAKNFESGEQV